MFLLRKELRWRWWTPRQLNGDFAFICLVPNKGHSKAWIPAAEPIGRASPVIKSASEEEVLTFEYRRNKNKLIDRLSHRWSRRKKNERDAGRKKRVASEILIEWDRTKKRNFGWRWYFTSVLWGFICKLDMRSKRLSPTKWRCSAIAQHKCLLSSPSSSFFFLLSLCCCYQNLPLIHLNRYLAVWVATFSCHQLLMVLQCWYFSKVGGGAAVWLGLMGTIMESWDG